MVPTVKLVLRKKHASDTEGYICLQVTVPNTGQAKPKSLGYKIPVKMWDADKQEVRDTYPDYKDINTVISDKKQKVKNSLTLDVLQDKAITPIKVKRLLSGKANQNVMLFFEEYINDLKEPHKEDGEEVQKLSHNTIRQWDATYNRLLLYSGDKLFFSDIDLKWLKNYQTHCAKTLEKKTSLPVHMRKIVMILNEAANSGLIDSTAFAKYKIPEYKNPFRQYLTLAQLDIIWEKIEKGSFKGTYETVAVFFLLECLCGLRFSDWSRFTIEKLIDKNRIKVSALKNGQPVYFPYHKSKRLKRVIQYIQKKKLTFSLSEQKTNDALRVVAGICEFDIAITTHVGRHTFATLMLELRYSYSTIADWMAISENTVKIYAKQIRTHANEEYEEKGGL